MAGKKSRGWFLLSLGLLFTTIALSRWTIRGEGGDLPQTPPARGAQQPAGEPASRIEASSNPVILRELADRERNEAIQRKLLRTVTLRAGTQPLETLLVDLARQNDIPLEIDQATIRDNGVALDQLVELHDVEVTLRSALRLICEQHHLSFVIREGMLKVTTSVRAGEIIETRVHAVGALVPENDYSELISLIPWAADPDSWLDQSGPPPVYCVPAARAVVFRQTADVHEKVADFLADLIRQTTGDEGTPPEDPIRDRERSIRQKLASAVDVDCDVDSVDEALTFLAKKHGLPLWLSKSDRVD